jgi:hypothetical protein
MRCNTHGEWNPRRESGCPHCVSEMRSEIKSLTALIVDIGDDEQSRLIPDLAFRVVRVRDKVIFAQHGDTGKMWRGKRKDIPTGYSEVA